ncbi:tail fiber domain-containing protein [Escherichia coli]|nr:tail fiber domain-containing protein [Escherichia coli]
MAVVGVPGWIGSSAANETGQRWMSQAAGQLRLGVPCWMSQFSGRSREIIHTLGADHNFNGQWFRDRCFEAGSTPIVFNITGDLVSYSKDVPLFFMYGDTPNEYVQLNIHGVAMYGRGGNGGSNGPGSAGGHCIQNDIGGRLRINNGGAIAGGGGGGQATVMMHMNKGGWYSWAANGDFTSSASVYCNDVYIRSDRRLKINVEDYEENAVDKVNKLKVKTYDKVKSLSDREVIAHEIGIIAQDLQEILPEAVSTSNVGSLDNPEEILTISNSAVNALLIKAVQEMSEENKLLRERLAAIEAKLG